MDEGPCSGLLWASTVVLELFLYLSLHHSLTHVKIGILIFLFPGHFVCYVTASFAIPLVGLITFPGLVQKVLRA